MEIKPFRAFRFDADVVGDVGSCISPPYDVISDEEQQQLYEKSEYNIVRIIKGKTIASDYSSNNQYTRAAEYLNSWIEKGILIQDSANAIYAYVQDFAIAGRCFQRNSFIALAKLEEFSPPGRVRPHEQTLDKPKADRLISKGRLWLTRSWSLCSTKTKIRSLTRLLKRQLVRQAHHPEQRRRAAKNRLLILSTSRMLDIGSLL
jgi:uncharacterized protein (DUF1015 family)